MNTSIKSQVNDFDESIEKNRIGVRTSHSFVFLINKHI